MMQCGEVRDSPGDCPYPVGILEGQGCRRSRDKSERSIGTQLKWEETVVVTSVTYPVWNTGETFYYSSREFSPFSVSSFAPEGGGSKKIETVSKYWRTSSMLGRLFG